MRRFLLAFALLVPLATGAADTNGQPKEWTQCAEDAQCKIVKGLCDAPVAVRSEYQMDAEAYFKKRAPDVKCVQKFWQRPIDKSAARCRIERCEVVGKEK